MELAVEVFSMLADATRVRIVLALSDGELPVNDLAEQVGKSPAAVSQRLAKLRLARAVATRQEGTRVFYRLTNEHARQLVSDSVFQAEHQLDGTPPTTTREPRVLTALRSRGVQASERTTGGHREYREPDVARVRFMPMLYAAGMPSRRIVEILPFLDTGVATRTMLDHFDEESDRIRRQIEALGAIHDRLARLRDIAAESVAGRPPEECRSSANSAAA